jgi:hypothetical protein
VLELPEVPELLDALGVLAALEVLGVLVVLGLVVESEVLAGLEAPLLSLFSAGVPAFSAAAFLPPSDFGAVPLSPLG